MPPRSNMSSLRPVVECLAPSEATLEARQIDASNGTVAQVTGEVETKEGVLVIRRIHESARETIERVHGLYAIRCPHYNAI